MSEDCIMEEESSKSYFNQAVILEKEKKWDDAISLYEKAISKDPKFIQAWLNLGSLQFKLGKKDEAIQSLKNALKLNKRLVQAHLILAQIYREKEKDKQTETYLTNAYKLDPKNKFAIGALAVFYFDNEKYNESLKMVNQYLSLYPDDKNLKLLRSEILIKQGNYKESLNELTQLTHQDSGFTQFNDSIENLKKDEKFIEKLDEIKLKTKKKLKEFKAKLELSKENPEDFLPPDPQDAMDLSLLYLFQGDSDKAIQYLVYAKKVNEELKEK